VTLSISGPKAFANPYHFSSKPFHELSGNYDFLRRWYDPSLQRWLTRDPLGETGGLNLYGFVGNTAVNTVDFDGRLWGRLASKLSRMLSDFADSTSSPSETYLASLASDAAAWFSKTDPWYSTYQDVNEFRKSGARCYLRNKYAGLEEVVGTADIVRAVDYEDEYTAWEQLGYGIVGGSKSFLTVIGARAMVEPTVAAENVVYREISAADRIALEAGQPLVPRGTGGSILDHVRGQPTGHISASQTVEGTARFNGGNGLVEIDVNAATSGGTRFLSHPEVLEGVGARPKQIQKVLESGEVMFQGPIPPNAVRRIR
jgi:RHS repeat-associated protein